MEGLAWIIGVLTSKLSGHNFFWELSYRTQDMYFSVLLESIQFQYKTLAIIMIFTFLILFTLGVEAHVKKNKIIILFFSTIFLLSAFYIHMIELLMIPSIFLITFLYESKFKKFYNILFLILNFLILFIILDFYMNGYYSNLSLLKVSLPLNYVFSLFGLTLTQGLIIFSLIFIFILGMSFLILFLCKKTSIRCLSKIHIPEQKVQKLMFVARIIILILIFIYVGSIIIWLNLDDSYYNNTLLHAEETILPFFMYFTRWGFMGLFGLIGIMISPWKQKWFKVAIFWFLTSFIIGNIWWGSVTIQFLFPVLALFAVIGIEFLISKIPSLNWKIGKIIKKFIKKIKWKENNLKPIETCVKFMKKIKWNKNNLKPIETCVKFMFVIVLLLGTSSYIYGTSYYSQQESVTKDEQALIFKWVYENVEQSSTILVPNDYIFYFGINTICNRTTYIYTSLPKELNFPNILIVKQIFQQKSIKYAILGEDLTPLMKEIKADSLLLEDYGTWKIYKIIIISGTYIDFVDADGSDANCTISIVANKDGHKKVLKILDNSNTGQINFHHYFDAPQTTGIIEFYSYAEQTDKQIGFPFKAVDWGYAVYPFMDSDGNFKYSHDGWNAVTVQSYNANQWYHHKIVFDCEGDSGWGTFDWYIDGVKKVTAGRFWGDTDNIYRWWFYTENIPIDAVFYFNAIDFSWASGYYDGRNKDVILDRF